MTRKSDSLDRLSIGNSCTANWEAMTGDRQKRFCQGCNKSVYNFSAMTRDEIAATVARFEGRLCARIERDASGAIITAAMPAAPQLISRRVSPVAAVLVTALLGLSGNVLAVTSNATAPAGIYSQAGKDGRAPQPQGTTATLSGTVKDPQGAVISGAKVMLINEQIGGQAGSTVSNDEGSFSFASLAEGVYTLRVEASGFKSAEIIDKEIRAGVTTQVEVALDIAIRMMGDVVFPPQPLLGLYQESSLIVVARLGSSTPVQAAKDDSQRKATLEVTSVVKGSNKQPKLTFYYSGWGEDNHFPGKAHIGDEVLAFLRVRDQGNGYELADTTSQRSLRKLSPADLAVYLQRIEELNSLSQSEQQDAAAIVDWLVRCAEQPATRWEGAYELARTIENDGDDSSDQPESGDDTQEPDDAPAAVNQTIAATPANSTDAQTAANGATCSHDLDPALFEKMLNDEQKTRLKAALFSTDTLTEDDLPLVTLVQHWKDKRFVPFLLEQLRHHEANPPQMTEPLVKAIADTMGTEDLTTFAETYSDEVNYDDLDDEGSDDKTEAAGGKGAETTASVAPNNKRAKAAAARQKRSEILHQFIALVEKKLEKQQAR